MSENSIAIQQGLTPQPERPKRVALPRSGKPVENFVFSADDPDLDDFIKERLNENAASLGDEGPTEHVFEVVVDPEGKYYGMLYTRRKVDNPMHHTQAMNPFDVYELNEKQLEVLREKKRKSQPPQLP